jgi:hypothetical protein
MTVGSAAASSEYRGVCSHAFTGSPANPGNVTSNTSMVLSTVSTGSTTISPPTARDCAIVRAQNSSKSVLAHRGTERFEGGEIEIESRHRGLRVG